MSRTSYAPKQTYTGTGSLATYTFNFKISAKSQLLIIEVDTDGTTETQRVRGTDTTYLSSVTFDAVDGGGTVVLASNLASGRSLILLLADDEPTQDYEFRNKTSFTLRAFENALDAISGAVQRLSYRGRQAFRIHDLDDEDTFDAQLPPGAASSGNRVLKVNSGGTGMEYGPTSDEVANAQSYAVAAQTAQSSAETAQTAAEAAQTAAETAETNAAASESAAATSETNAATSETNAQTAQAAAEAAQTAAETAETNAAASESAAATSATNAQTAYNDTLALLSATSNKQSISDSQTNTDLTNATIDETTHFAGEFSYVLVRGSTYQHGKLLVTDQSPFTVDVIDERGNAGVTFGITESAGVGTLNYTSDASGAGTIYYNFVKYAV